MWLILNYHSLREAETELRPEGNLQAGANTWRPWRSYWLAQPAFIQNPGPAAQGVPIDNGLALPYQSQIKKMSYRLACLQLILRKHFLNCGFLFLRTLACVKLT